MAGIADTPGKPRIPEEAARRELGLAVTLDVKAFDDGCLPDTPRQPFHALSSRT